MFLFYWLSKLPLSLLYRLADLIYVVAYYVIKYRKKVVMTNLQNAFPQKTPKELTCIAKDFYKNLSDTIIETIKVLSMSENELKTRVQIENKEVCLNYLQNGKSVIVMASHQANWEWLLLGNAVHLKYDVDAVYKPLRNPFYERLMLKIRSRFGPYPVAMNQLPREMVKRKAITRIIALVADQTPAPETAYWTRFLNQDTPFYTGAAKIAQRTGYVVLFTSMWRVKRGYYQTAFHTLMPNSDGAASVDQVIEAYARAVEKAIEAHPAQWLWSHKRWKHTRTTHIG